MKSRLCAGVRTRLTTNDGAASSVPDKVWLCFRPTPTTHNGRLRRIHRTALSSALSRAALGASTPM